MASLIGCGSGSSDGNQTKEGEDTPSELPSELPPAPPEIKSYRATLHWSQPPLDINNQPLTNLSGFKIQYGTSPEKLDQMIMINDPKLNIAVINNLTADEYYVSMTALTDSGLESTSSAVYNVSVGQ